MDLDNIKIEDMRLILNEDTTLSRYYSLIPMKGIIIDRLVSNGIIYKSQYDEIYTSDTEKIRKITGMEKEENEKFYSVLHLHDFKNKSIRSLLSLNSNVIAEVTSRGYKKTLDIIVLDSEKSEEEMSEILNIKKADVQRLVSMCHLMRLPGVKDIRASLYYDAGLCTLDCFRNVSFEKIYKIIEEYILHSGCGKSVPQKKELMTQIAVSKILP